MTTVTPLPRFVITGPECSGKTTLACALAHHYRTTATAEYAITYLQGQRPPGSYDFADLKRIAEGQLDWENRAGPYTNGLLICDTSMLVIAVWSQVRFGSVDPWITAQLHSNRYAGYLLCRPEMNWEPAAFRENPSDRGNLYEEYLNHLRKHRLKFVEIGGNREKRRRTAINWIDKNQE